MPKNMTEKTARKYVKMFQDHGFTARVDRCIFVRGFKILVNCSAPLKTEVWYGGRRTIRNLGRHNTQLSAYTFQEVRELIREINVGDIRLPD